MPGGCHEVVPAVIRDLSHQQNLSVANVESSISIICLPFSCRRDKKNKSTSSLTMPGIDADQMRLNLSLMDWAVKSRTVKGGGISIPNELYFLWGYYGTHYRVRFYPPFGVYVVFYIRNIILLGSITKKNTTQMVISLNRGTPI